ncbi:MFS transporter [Paraburkholderia sp. BL18I3N2]|nr:MFS transporter [Paraburkholderia sp. BL18I3N2]
MFLMAGLGASATTIGLLEGFAEATAPIVKVFSGTLSDYLGNRKWLAVAGYGLGALSKPLFAVASTIGIVMTARIIDRVGKGIRGAPRDALVADVTSAHLRGAAFGLRQSLDTVGAFLGPLLAVVIMLLWADNFRLAFWLAVIPGLLAVALLAFGIEEPAREPGAKRVNPIRWDSIKQLGTSYWWVVVVGAVFALARFSEAFLVLRAMRSGVPIALVPLVMVAKRRVCAVGVSVRETCRHDEPHQVAGRGPRYFDCIGCGARTWHALERCARGGGAMGSAHGDDPRIARHDGLSHRARATARHRVRFLQPSQRRRYACA